MKHGRDKKHRIKDHGILVVPRLGGELGYEEYLIFGAFKKKKKKCICDTKSQHLFPNPIEEVIHLVFNTILHTDAVENFPLK